ncbi:MAG: SBBP repeat-containing protein, partial [Candidatus Brocadia sp.]
MNKIHVYLSLTGKRFHIVSGIAVLFSSIIVSTVFGSFLAQKTALLYPSLGPVHEDKASIDWDEGRKVKLQGGYGTLPLFFIQNNGQMDERVRFYERGQGHTTFLTERGVCLSLVGSQQSAISGQERDRQQKAAVRNQRSGKTGTSEIIRDWPSQPLKPLTPKSQLIKLIPLGRNKNAEIVAKGKQVGTVNYFIGNDHKKWKTGIPTYSAVVYKDLYKDIDMRVYGNNHQLEYDIIVKPGASPSRVQLLYQGTEGLRVTEGGDLEISLNDGTLIQKKPYIYQEIDGKRVEVAGKFKIRKGELHSGKRNEEAVHGNASPVLNSREGARNDSSTKLTTRNSKHFVYSFQVASYDKRYPLVIDPTMVYSTYFGGSDYDYSYSIAVDSVGNAYVTGNTYSEDFPTASALYGSNRGGGDVFVTKLDASGNSLVYSTYLGGSSWDFGIGIAIDTSGNAYVTGETASTDFPTASALFGNNAEYDTDAFITKLDASGSNLIYSTYLGGSKGDSGFGIAVDTAGNAYVTGNTYSTDFPTASALFENNTEYDTDAFITKLNALGSLIYSSYLGGSDVDSGLDIAVDISGNAYVSGYTFSDDFPTASPLFGSHRELSDVFVTKIKYDLQAHYAFDEGSGTITVDSFGNGNDGTIHGAAWTTGKSGGGLYFDGIDDYVTIPRMNNDEVSIAAWFYKNAYDDLRAVTIFGGRRWNPDVQLREGFSLKFYANNPHILEFILVTQDGNGNRTQRSAGFDLSDSVGNWYHVACTYNKTTGVQML